MGCLAGAIFWLHLIEIGECRRRAFVWSFFFKHKGHGEKPHEGHKNFRNLRGLCVVFLSVLRGKMHARCFFLPQSPRRKTARRALRFQNISWTLCGFSSCSPWLNALPMFFFYHKVHGEKPHGGH